MIVGIDARIPIATGRGWGRYTRELVDALAQSSDLALRVLLPASCSDTAWVRRRRDGDRVRFACVEFNPASPDDYERAARGITIESCFDGLDLVHSPTRFILPTSVRPLVATVHDVAPLADPPFKPQYLAATRRAVEFIRREHVTVMAVSAFTKDELAARAGFDTRDVVVVHQGVSALFCPGPPAASATPFVLYVGGAGANKNLDRLLSAMTQLRRSCPVDLLMAGDRAWDHAELRQVFGVEIPAWIRLRGYVSDEQLADLYRGAAACVMPSLHEGFGLPVLEAMACGTPLACSSIPVFEEVAGDAAAYFDPFDESSIAAAVQSLLDDKARATVLGARGRTRARDFTWSATARKTIDVYRRSLRAETMTASSH